MSQLTTHILDTSIGKPAEGIHVLVEQNKNNSWIRIAEGVSNTDGRISNLLVGNTILDQGDYRLVFDTAPYFKNQKKNTFYPKVTIEFTITDQSHYHVPLLLNPFGYSTYRGS